MINELEEIRALLLKSMAGDILSEQERANLESWIEKNESQRRVFVNALHVDEELLQMYLHYVERTESFKKRNTFHKLTIPVRSTSRQRIFRFLAAAAVLVAVVTGSLLFFNRAKAPEGKQPVAEKTTKGTPGDIMPGKSKAILQLADNRVVELSNEGSVQIDQNLSTVDGQLQYANQQNSSTLSQSTSNTVTTPRGASYRIVLPDGTLVSLNAESSCTYFASYEGADREITVTGEVYLQVAKHQRDNRPVPFSVKTPDGATIRVLGTSFNVNAYATSRKTTTTLLEGKVEIDVPQPGNTHTKKLLKPGQRAVVRGASVVIQPTNAQASIEWTQNVFSFDNRDLKEILHDIARNYDVDLEFRTNDIPGDELIYGSLDKNVPLSQLLKRLSKLTETDLIFTVEDRKLVVSKK